MWLPRKLSGTHRFFFDPSLFFVSRFCHHIRSRRQRWSPEDRADVCAANLHTIEVADAHYLNKQVAADANLDRQGGPAGEFIRGLGKRTSFLIS